MNLHDEQRETTVGLLKAALAQENGVALFKGDSPGHEFHGNQYSDGGASAKAANIKSNAANHATRSAENSAGMKHGPAAHLAAAKAHHTAYDAHIRAAGKVAEGSNLERHHESRAAQHDKQARAHEFMGTGKRSKKSDSADDLTKSNPEGINQYTGSGDKHQERSELHANMYHAEAQMAANVRASKSREGSKVVDRKMRDGNMVSGTVQHADGSTEVHSYAGATSTSKYIPAKAK